MPYDLGSISFRQSVQRRIPGYVRVIQVLLYLSVLIFTILGAMGGFIWAIPALGTLFGSWYFMGLMRVTYEYRLDGTQLEVKRLSGMRSKPKSEDFLELDLKNVTVAADEGAPELDDAEQKSLKAVPKRITCDISAHDPNRACAVMYGIGGGKESGRLLKIYFQPSAELCSYLRLICPGRVFIHAEGE